MCAVKSSARTNRAILICLNIRSLRRITYKCIQMRLHQTNQLTFIISHFIVCTY